MLPPCLRRVFTFSFHEELWAVLKVSRYVEGQILYLSISQMFLLEFPCNSPFLQNPTNLSAYAQIMMHISS